MTPGERSAVEAALREHGRSAPAVKVAQDVARTLAERGVAVTPLEVLAVLGDARG